MTPVQAAFSISFILSHCPEKSNRDERLIKIDVKDLAKSKRSYKYRYPVAQKNIMLILG
jgi:hypothetical protein